MKTLFTTSDNLKLLVSMGLFAIPGPSVQCTRCKPRDYVFNILMAFLIPNPRIRGPAEFQSLQIRYRPTLY